MELQLGFSDFEKRKSNHHTRKEKFLARMEDLFPWATLEILIEPYYPKRGNGRPPYPLSSMLRIHCLQQWYSLSDLAAEDALYETTPMRRFAQHSLDHAIPDHTTIMNFRHLLESYELGRQIFEAGGIVCIIKHGESEPIDKSLRTNPSFRRIWLLKINKRWVSCLNFCLCLSG